MSLTDIAFKQATKQLKPNLEMTLKYEAQIMNIMAIINLPYQEGLDIIEKLLNKPYEYSLKGIRNKVSEGTDIRKLL